MHNRWVFCLLAAVLLGTVSALYDKYLMSSPTDGGLGLNRLTVQSYFNFYQLAIMLVVVWLEHRHGRAETRFQWRWTIPLISIFICAADLAYFYSLSLDDAMISIVSMVRRGSVIVSFHGGCLRLPREQPQDQGRGPHPGAPGHAVPLLGHHLPIDARRRGTGFRSPTGKLHRYMY